MNEIIEKMRHFTFEEQNLKQAFVLSSLVHFFLILIFFIVTKFNFDFLPSLSSNQNKIKQIKSAVRVDVVGMPKYTLQELRQMKLPSISTEVKTPPPVKDKASSKESQSESDLTFKKKGKSKKSIDDILKNLSKKNLGNETKKAKETKKVDISHSEIKKLVLEGNQVSKGSAIVGESSAQVLEAFDAYIGQIPEVVREFWELPTFLRNQKNLKCRVRIFISSKGKLINAEIYESSGVEEYDSEALNSVKKVTLFPVPPQSIVHKVSSGEIVLGFPL